MSSVILPAVLLITYGPLVLAHPSGNSERGPATDLSLLSDDLVFGLYAMLVKQKPEENLLFSPLGISSTLLEVSRVCHALCLTSCQTEILAALGLQNRTEEDPSTKQATLHTLDGLVTDLETEGRGEPQFSTQTFLQLNDKRLSLGQYVNQSCGVGERNVASKPGQPKSENTKCIFSRRSPNKLILLNKVQMTGRWRQPFDSRRTLSWRFHPNATASVEVAMMYRDDRAEQKMLYDTNCSTTVVQLQYSGRLSAVLLLPRGVIRPLEDCLSFTKMKFWLSNLKSGRAEIHLPRFAVKTSYTLEQALKTSGIQEVFSQQSLQFSQALHEVELVVNESKAEDTGRSDTSIDLSEPHRIIFDRPFMLIVYDEITEAIVLMGKIMDPTVV